MKITFNKWHIKLGLIPLYYRLGGLQFNFGIFKIHTKPPEGEMIQSKHYYGFWFKKDINQFIILDF